MKQRTWIVAALALSVLLTGACAKKSPATAPEAAGGATAAASGTAPTPAVGTASPADPLAGDLDAVNEYLRQQGLLGAVYFDYDSADLRAEARERLAQNARFLLEHPQFVVAIEGHCDERGTAEYNLALGDRRATSTRSFLTTLGVAGERLRTISYGEERPECGEHVESCHRRNRRAQFVVVSRSSMG
ncbi:MAG TPA: peptidoglycan-associated lipoprotein Pal [Thermoanaerobaculia bacterium]|nr:peptidoglycan-associated lipoprotein Pal [Thermoanaerobaculia bacterium]